jgi:hypothetical protein
MGSIRTARTSVVAALLAACGGAKPTAPAATAAADSAKLLDFATMKNGVLNASGSRPPCPVIPHFDAVLVIARMSGTVRYRWERSTGDTTKTFEAKIPADASTGQDTLVLKSDEWLDKDRGVQHIFTDQVHVLSPVDKVSPQMSAQAICF